MEDKILTTVVDNLKYNFEKDILVKPLAPIMIERTVTEQIPNGKKDKDGNNLYDTKEEKKQVESDFGRGIILALPTVYSGSAVVGDTVVYPKKFVKEFDVFKDSLLVKPYDIVAIETKQKPEQVNGTKPNI